MNNRNKNFERPDPEVVGSISEERKGKPKREISNAFKEGHEEGLTEEDRILIENYEQGKEQFEIEIIEEANFITNAIIEEFNLEPFDVPIENFHIVQDEGFEELEWNPDRIAVSGLSQQIFISKEKTSPSPVFRSKIILHEMLHLKGFLSFEGDEDGFTLRRSGIEVFPTLKDIDEMGLTQDDLLPSSFQGLDEAIVEEMTKRCLPELIESSEVLENERDCMESEEGRELRREAAEEEEMRIDEIAWVTEEGYGRFHYYNQRQVLYFLIDSIFKENKNDFNTKDEVAKEFFRAHFTGRLLTVARLVEEVFGKGSFRKLGEMDKDSDSAVEVFEYLKNRME